MKIRGIAHRGYPGKAPENTLSSFQLAYDLSYTHLELDVHLSKDGIPVLMHDFSVDRMTNGNGLIRDYTLEELKQLKVGGVETIPTLEEALHMLKGKMSILVEMKQAENPYPNFESTVLDVVKRTDTVDQVRIVSFDQNIIVKMRELHPSIELGFLCTERVPNVFSFMKDIQCHFLGAYINLMSPTFYESMLEHDIIPGPWPINELDVMEAIAEKYPEALITTDYLERWADFYRQRPVLHLQ